MKPIDLTILWIVILGLALGSYALRFAFIGLVGGRELPPWLLRHLRYTAVAIIPALIAPLVMWPAATGGTPDLSRGMAALVTLVIAVWTRSAAAAMLAGGATLFGLLYFA
ncbi:MAG: AzlD domain-containing protein [Pseudomonadota bacterium]